MQEAPFQRTMPLQAPLAFYNRKAKHPIMVRGNFITNGLKKYFIVICIIEKYIFILLQEIAHRN
jgi:hypothetical protein